MRASQRSPTQRDDGFIGRIGQQQIQAVPADEAGSAEQKCGTGVHDDSLVDEVRKT